MSTPVEEHGNPLDDLQNMAATSAEGGTPTNQQGPSKGKKRVGFTGGTDGDGKSQQNSWSGTPTDTLGSSLSLSPNHGSPEASGSNTPSQGHTRSSSVDHLLGDKAHLPQLSQQQTDEIKFGLVGLDVPGRPRPAIRRSVKTPEIREPDEHIDGPDDDDQRTRRRVAREAFERGKTLEMDERMYSGPNSRQPSPIRMGSKDIQLDNLHYGSAGESDDEMRNSRQRGRRKAQDEASRLVRSLTERRGAGHASPNQTDVASGFRSGATTPTEEQNFMEDYQPRPQQYRGGILGSLLKLRDAPSRPRGGDYDGASAMSTPQHSPPESGATTPTNRRRSWWGHESRNQSTSSLATLIGSSASAGSPAVVGLAEQVSQRLGELEQHQKTRKRPGLGRHSRSGNALLHRFGKHATEEQFRITEHIAETIVRQKYLMKLCKCLMQYGAPTHRLEEYMTMSARVLETDAQFLYIPGSMIMSFEDQGTHTSEVKLVKVAQGLDLGKLRDVHEVYKEVVHDKLGVEEATHRLKEISNRNDKFRRLYRVIIYGLASVCVGPFAFGARFIDLPISFVLGCILGFLQLYIVPRSDLYANVFEIAAVVISSFLARAFGSIRGGDLFCFSALAQSSIALILPGYTVLCAALELQSRSIVAGSVRMVYAIIYSLFLGYAITVGTALYGLMDSKATSKTECTAPMSSNWYFFFVFGFTMCLIIINQAKWKQAPMMVVIAMAGYVVNFYSSQHFKGNTQISNTLGALAIGILANGYSRVGGWVENKFLDLYEATLRPRWREIRKRLFRQSQRRSMKVLEEGRRSSAGDGESVYTPRARRVGYSLAAAAMLPAIFVQVPSGLAVNGSLVSGLASANQITGVGTNGTQVINSTSLSLATEGVNSIAFSVGYSVIQVAIGITVGLFLSAVVVYPLGKKRSGLFSF